MCVCVFACVCVCTRVRCPWYLCVCVHAVVWLLIRVHLTSWCPSEGLVEGAISTQHSPHSYMKGLSSFILFQPNCLICICFVTRHQDSNMALFYFPFLLSHVISCRFFSSFYYFALKSVTEVHWGRHTHMYTGNHFIFNTKKEKENWHEKQKGGKSSPWHPCFFFSFSMSFREGALQCLLCSSRQGRPFCLWKSQWKSKSGEHLPKHFAHHRSALPAPLAI